MEVLEMDPLVRYINIVLSPQRYPEPVLAYDFRMLYMVEGGLCVQMQDKSFVLCPGGFVWANGEKYCGNCGFKDASYFCKFFVRHMKMTPKQYRKLVK